MTKEPVSVAEDENDVALILRAKKDPENFRPIYEKYYKKIFVFVLYRVGDKALCADITSQVFLKALLNVAKFEYKGVPISAWLYRIALNECNDFFRKSKRARFVAIENSGIQNLHEGLTNETRIEDLQQRLPVILAQLSPDELHLLELRYFEQRPFKEVANILGITETYAKVKVYRLLDKMKTLFLK